MRRKDAKLDAEETIVLKPKRLKLFALLCFSTALCLVGILMIRHDIRHGWIVALSFGLGVVALPIVLVTNHGCLTISPEGFTLRGAFRSDTYGWTDVEGFGVGTIAHNRMVVFNCSRDFPQMKRARAAAAAITGFECAISDLYGVPVEELADMMNAYKTQHDARS